MTRMTAATASGLGCLALLAGGCGDGGTAFTPTGTAAGQAAPASGTPPPARHSVSPSSPSADEPAFPADLRVLYQPRTAPPGGAAAVRAFGTFWRAWWYAVATGGADARYRQYVAAESTLGGTQIFSEVVDGWAKEKVRPVGTIRAYGVRVLSVGGQVLLAGCADESKAGTKNVNTGKVSWSFGQRTTSRYKIRVVMARTGGTWRVSQYLPVPVTDPAGRECRG